MNDVLIYSYILFEFPLLYVFFFFIQTKPPKTFEFTFDNRLKIK